MRTAADSITGGLTFRFGKQDCPFGQSPLPLFPWPADAMGAMLH